MKTLNQIENEAEFLRLCLRAGDHQKAAELINREAGCCFSKIDAMKLRQGECGPNILALSVYALKSALEKQEGNKHE